MTENSWPQTPSPVSTGGHPPTEAAGSAAAEDSPSTPETAKDEAGKVARHATDAVQNVTDTAKSEAANVAAEVKTNARDLLAQAKSDLTDQAGTQQQKVAEGLRSVSTELHSMVSSADQPGVATDLVRQAAERTAIAASWLEGRDPGSLLSEVKSFARQKPGTFLLLAAGAGVLAGRLTRSLSAGAPEPAGARAEDTGPTTPPARVPDTGRAVPPVPVESPTVQVAKAGAADTTLPDPAGTSAQPAFGGQDRWYSEPVVTDPLQPVDPLHDDPFGGGRR